MATGSSSFSAGLECAEPYDPSNHKMCVFLYCVECARLKSFSQCSNEERLQPVLKKIKLPQRKSMNNKMSHPLPYVWLHKNALTPLLTHTGINAAHIPLPPPHYSCWRCMTHTMGTQLIRGWIYENMM